MLLKIKVLTFKYSFATYLPDIYVNIIHITTRDSFFIIYITINHQGFIWINQFYHLKELDLPVLLVQSDLSTLKFLLWWTYLDTGFVKTMLLTPEKVAVGKTYFHTWKIWLINRITEKNEKQYRKNIKKMINLNLILIIDIKKLS